MTSINVNLSVGLVFTVTTARHPTPRMVNPPETIDAMPSADGEGGGESQDLEEEVYELCGQGFLLDERVIRHPSISRGAKSRLGGD